MPTVLIVDDEKNIRATLARGLRLEGYRTEEAQNGRAALPTVDEGGIDLILLGRSDAGNGRPRVSRRVAGPRAEHAAIVLTAHGSIERAVQA